MRKVILLLCALLTLAVAVDAQTRQVTGKVVDKGGEALIGVSVGVKGSSTGVATDMKGSFKISVPETGNPVLVFKYVGFKTKEVAVGSQTQISVTIEEDVTSLKEVKINIGYGQTVSKEASTGSVSSVTAKQLADVPLSTAAEALTGRLAGVQVVSSEGTPGADVKITVRGGNSITQDNSPLYIVDGIQVENALSLLSPQEIQTIDVLKDAASTSIYGARGANGVVIITTKGGKKMKPQLTYNAFGGYRSLVKDLDVLSPYEFVKYQYEAYNGSADDRTTFTNRYGLYQDLDLYQQMPFTNWQQKLFGRDAFSQTHIIGLTGGTTKTSYNFTLNRVDEKGIMLGSGFDRTLVSGKIDHKLTKGIKLGVTARYSNQGIDGVGTSADGSSTNSRLRNSVRYKPFSAGEDAEFDETDLTLTKQTNLANPVILVQNELKEDEKKDWNLSAYADVQLLKNISFRTTFGYTTQDRDVVSYYTSPSGRTRSNNALDQPVLEYSDSKNHTFNNANTLSYSNTFNKDHKLDVLLGQETYQTKTTSVGQALRWFPVGTTMEQASKDYSIAVPPATQVQDPLDNGYDKSRLLSFFGRSSYSYKGRYLATLSLRYDGSSKFNTENRFEVFPSGSLGWRISDESFMEPAKGWLSNLKLRASLGSAGNNRIPNDLFVTVFGIADGEGYAFDNTVTQGTIPNALANNTLQWEVTLSRNLGLDFGFLNNRINGSIDLYRNTTDDLLLNANIPSSSGWATQQQNIGKTQNQGFEFQLGANVISNKNFTWNTNFNLTINKNKIVNLGLDPSGNPKKSYTTGSGWVSSGYQDYLVEVGKPVGQFYGYVTDGRYTIDDFNYTQNANGSWSYTLKPDVVNTYNLNGNQNPLPGSLKLKKLTEVDPSKPESYKITEADRTVLGTAQPKFIGGLNQQFAYKGFDMSVYMNWSVGNKVYNANKIEFTSQYGNKDNNLLASMANRWNSYDENGVRVTDPEQLRAMNESTTMWTPQTSLYFLHSYAIEDGSFLRLSNLTLGYTLPKALVKRTKVVSNLRFYATVNNLLTITGYDGYDPEANTRGKNPLTPGVDYSAYPRSRFVLAGVNLTF